MGQVFELRDDDDGPRLRSQAKRSRHGGQARRRPSLAVIFDGASRSEAARLAGATLRIVLVWVRRLNAVGPDGLVDRQAPGPKPKQSEAGSARGQVLDRLAESRVRSR